MKKHIILDIVSMWLFVAIVLLLGALWDIVEFFIFSIPLIIWFLIRTSRWIVWCYDALFGRVVVVKSKGYRFSATERIYALDITKKICYSVILFDDVRLQGKYIFLENSTFKNGEELEITYYKNSKVIKSISKC